MKHRRYFLVTGQLRCGRTPPIGAIREYGFYVQMAQMIMPNRLELSGQQHPRFLYRCRSRVRLSPSVSRPCVNDSLT